MNQYGDIYNNMKRFYDMGANVTLLLNSDGSGSLEIIEIKMSHKPHNISYFDTPEELLSFLDREFFVNSDGVLFFDKEAFNGIMRVKDGQVGFYSIFDCVVTLDDGCENEKYFKSLEEDLTAEYGKAYCETHSRKLDDEHTCDICEVWNSAPY